MNIEEIRKEAENLKDLKPTQENLEKINEIIKKLEDRKNEIISIIKNEEK